MSDMIDPNELELRFRQTLLDKGFSESDIEEHIDVLNDIISKGTLAALLESKPASKKFVTGTEAVAYVQEHFSEEETLMAIEETSKKVMQGYLETVGIPIEELS
jgi:hypothetical protein